MILREREGGRDWLYKGQSFYNHVFPVTSPYKDMAVNLALAWSNNTDFFLLLKYLPKRFQYNRKRVIFVVTTVAWKKNNY